MNATAKIEALRLLHASIDLDNRVDALLKFTAAWAIVDRWIEQVGGLSEAERHQSLDYISGLLLGYIQKVEWAVMPWPQADKSPSEYLELARFDLSMAETKARGA